MPRAMPLLLLALAGCEPVEDSDPHNHGSGYHFTRALTAPRPALGPGDTGAPDLPPGCGDGLLQVGEECDANADDLCPGACSAHCACPALEAGGQLQVHVLDVGQADAILVVSPDGFTLLIDAANSGEGDNIQRYMNMNGITGLNYTLVTHSHADHLGAMDEVLRDHPEVVACFDHGGVYSSQGWEDYVEEAGRRRRTVVVGDLIDMGPSLQVEVLHAWIGSDNENDNSVVLRLVQGDVRALLGGDCETDGCERSFSPGPIDIYKVHHHGSSDSSYRGLLGDMMPSLAIISVGADNDYGHPHASTLRHIHGAGAAIHRTDQDGPGVVFADGETWWPVQVAR